MKTRSWWMLSVMVAVGLALAGCNSGGGSATDGPAGTPADPAAATPEAKAGEGRGTGADTVTKTPAEPKPADANEAGTRPVTAVKPPEPAKKVAPEGDASGFAGTYQMVITPQQAKLNAEMEKRKRPPFAGSITIDGKGGYTFKFGPKGKERETTGTTQVKGDQITLTPQLVEGKVPTNEGEKRAIVFKLGADGKTLEPQGDFSVKFKK